MRTEHLEYLLDLQKTLSLTKTADNFFTSHQVINNAIKSLEKELEVKILLRSPKGVTFTAEGDHVCQFASDIVQRREQLLLTISPYQKSTPTSLKGDLAIYVIPRFANKKFLKFYSAFCKKNHRANITVNMLPINQFFTQLPFKTPTIFLAAIHSGNLFSEEFKETLNTHLLHYEIITEQKLGYCVSKKSKWYDYITNNTFNEYPDVPLVAFNYALINNDKYFTENKQNYTLIDSFESQKELIKHGQYVATCTPWEFKHFFQSSTCDLTFIPGDKTEASFYYVVLVSENYRNEKLVINAIHELKKFFSIT